jgi:hypothetical protein
VLCFLYTGSDIAAPRGWPLGIGFTVFTALALDEYGMRDFLPLFDDRGVRWMAYALLWGVVALVMALLPPAVP